MTGMHLSSTARLHSFRTSTQKLGLSRQSAATEAGSLKRRPPVADSESTWIYPDRRTAGRYLHSLHWQRRQRLLLDPRQAELQVRNLLSTKDSNTGKGPGISSGLLRYGRTASDIIIREYGGVG